jgi:hypothetical protein
MGDDDRGAVRQQRQQGFLDPGAARPAVGNRLTFKDSVLDGE